MKANEVDNIIKIPNNIRILLMNEKSSKNDE